MNQEKIGKYIKELRLENNMTQDEFAKRLNVTPQAVSKWENGKNIPDISIIKEICRQYDVDINDLLDNEKKTKKNKWPIIVIVLIALCFIIVILSLNNSSDFELKNLDTTCSNFNIVGSAAFNKKKTSINISKIDYCGKKDETIYDEITCNIYRKSGDDKKLIKSCGSDKNIDIDSFAKDLSIKVDDYNNVCSNINDIIIELNASKDNTYTNYDIPIKMEDDCKGEK